ncbi:MAG TPA: type II toxin-antitoxin system HicA family toxin [Candidatus Kapabacteria bacterium]|nr:type II toxin-antitoxin system HicA family toxin [Candidatus Kapabacteria bacterium]
MSDFPSLTGKELIKAFSKIGFIVVRIRGSHNVIQHPDGRSTVVPIHSNESLGKGILSKILRDVELSRSELKELL